MKKVSIYTILIILLLLISFLSALLRLEHPHVYNTHWGDGTRDYMAAHYIVQDGERPLLTDYGGKRGSPLYFYLLAGFLKIKDSVFFLGIVNILFHIATIFLIYLVVKYLFDPFKAILSSLLYAIIPEVFQQTEFVFAPHQMQPFAYLALFLLILSYKKNNFKIALLSLVTICFAGAIHGVAFAWVPIFLILIFWMLRKKAQRVRFYIFTFFTLISSIAVLYLPVLFYYLQNSQAPKDLSINSVLPEISQNFIFNLFSFLSIFIEALSLNLTRNFQIDNLIAATLIIICIIYYFFTQKRNAKAMAFLGVCFFVSPTLFVSLLTAPNKYPIYYLLLSFGIFAIFVIEIVVSSINHMLQSYSYRLRTLVALIIILFLIKTVSYDFVFIRYKKNPEILSAFNASVDSMEHEISKIKTEKNFPSFNFFQIVSFGHTSKGFSSFPPLNTIFLLPLEKNLGAKLARTDDNYTPWSLRQNNEDNFIILVCIEYYNQQATENCTGTFSQSYPNHRVIKNIYIKHPLSVYLAKNVYLMN